ncbi:hypothetical protein Pfo_022550 [Paulownia fortunei]|nr:hypothetical protein Pfo_022550 [Paulownia fortunei]
MAPQRKVTVMVYTRSQVSQDYWTVTYDRLPIAYMRIPCTTTFSELLLKLYERTRIDSNQFSLKVFAKFSQVYMQRIKESIVEITDNDSLGFFLDPEAEINNMDIYVEKEQIHHSVAPPEMMMNHEWGSYMSLLAQDTVVDLSMVTQGMSTIGIDDLCVGASTFAYANFGIGQYNIESSSMREADNSYTEYILDAEPDDANDPIADSFGPNIPSDSEPNEVEHPIPNDNEDNVDVDIMLNTFLNSQSVQPSNSNEHILYPSIPFISTTYPEIYADSIFISTGDCGKFYDSNKGVLDVGMIFKDKKHLISVVKDFSIRFARREYRVVESTPKLWKVVYKHSITDMWRRWELRASLKANLGMFKITRYGGNHTCMIDRMSVDHHNLDKNYIATLLVGIIWDDPMCQIKYVMQFVKQKLGFEISYSKAWYSLKRTRENVYGTWESSVQKLPKFMRALQKSNEGTIVEQKIIKYVFWAFKPCIEGFHHCRKVISVDGTHLYTKYKHKMLIAVAMDGNQ